MYKGEKQFLSVKEGQELPLMLDDVALTTLKSRERKNYNCCVYNRLFIYIQD